MLPVDQGCKYNEHEKDANNCWVGIFGTFDVLTSWLCFTIVCLGYLLTNIICKPESHEKNGLCTYKCGFYWNWDEYDKLFMPTKPTADKPDLLTYTVNMFQIINQILGKDNPSKYKMQFLNNDFIY